MKKIVFRLNYHTVVGQSLWLKISVNIGEARFEQLLPMRWINDGQWQTEWETDWRTGPDFLLFSYRYIYRQAGNGVELEEWGGPRVIGAFEDAVVALDTWCSAGAVDHAYDTKALKAATEPRRIQPQSMRGNHDFNCGWRVCRRAVRFVCWGIPANSVRGTRSGHW
ncbi:MAG TPA: hypothetical protein VM511_09545 [Luteolibacter sp.]|nr:hypothetical protein [Luteolibacter sp.]